METIQPKVSALAKLSALAQETRLDVFRVLVEAGSLGLAAGAIGERLGVPAPTLSFHLKELRGAGVVRAQRDGRSIVYRADFGAMRWLVDYLLANCCRGEEERACAAGSAISAPGLPAEQVRRR